MIGDAERVLEFYLAWGWLSIRSLLVLGLVEYKNFTWPGVELYLAWGRALLGLG